MEIDYESGRRFTAKWAAAWNAHDLEAVPAHFAEEAEFSSPMITVLTRCQEGTRYGRQVLRAYWTEGLAKLWDLRFTLEDMRVGIDTAVVHHRNERGRAVAEVLTFGQDGLVVRGQGTYGPEV
jgi:ketosteroid isomerase-like protein